jgi:hypothetical protein
VERCGEDMKMLGYEIPLSPIRGGAAACRVRRGEGGDRAYVAKIIGTSDAAPCVFP